MNRHISINDTDEEEGIVIELDVYPVMVQLTVRPIGISGAQMTLTVEQFKFIQKFFRLLDTPHI